MFSSRLTPAILLKHVFNKKSSAHDLSRFSQKLHSLKDRKLLDLYGTWHQDNRALSITGNNEYNAIRQSLYVMLKTLEYETTPEIINELAKDYAEDDFTFVAVKANDEKQSKAITDNLNKLLELRNNLRRHWGEMAYQKLIHTFLLHDLGKQKQFNLENGIAPENFSAASHDLVLHTWLEKHPQEKIDFELADSWVDSFDGLGYNPQMLLSEGYIGVLTPVEHALAHLRTLCHEQAKNPHTQALNQYLFNKAKKLQLDIQDFKFLMAEETRSVIWPELPEPMQNKIVMLLLCCPFVFYKAKTNDKEAEIKQVVKDFIAEWHNKNHEATVDKITQFMITNIYAKDPLFIYNITGLIHHTDKQDGSHFANGGTVEELFTKFFPFVLEIVKGDLIPIESAKERSFNKFQALQGIELLEEMMHHLNQGSHPQLRGINFASKEVKNQYFSILSKYCVSNDAVTPQSTVKKLR